jgi:hypothetical protein
MKRVLLAAALCALALSACDTLRARLEMPTNEKPVVNVVNGVISVDPDPLRFRRDHGAVVIIWEIAASEQIRFADDGITIDGEFVDGQLRKGPSDEFVEFKKLGDGRKFQVRNKNSRKGSYKYTVKLLGPGDRPLPPFDPAIVNME